MRGFSTNGYGASLQVTNSGTVLGFANRLQSIGTTRRQDVEAGVTFRAGRLDAWLDYAYTHATFQTPLTLDTPLNPGANTDGQIQVQPGNRLPGVPTSRLKFGADYGITAAWTVGLSGIASSGRPLFGDEANLTKRTAPYVVLTSNTRSLSPAAPVAGYGGVHVTF